MVTARTVCKRVVMLYVAVRMILAQPYKLVKMMCGRVCLYLWMSARVEQIVTAAHRDL